MENTIANGIEVDDALIIEDLEYVAFSKEPNSSDVEDLFTLLRRHGLNGQYTFADLSVESFAEFNGFDAEELQAYCAALAFICKDEDGGICFDDDAELDAALMQAAKILRRGNYRYVPDVETWAELGDRLIVDAAGRYLPEFFWDFIDTEALGEEVAESEQGHFTHFGYFTDNPRGDL